ncbi:uncharacterized protein [Arachis hypogaea]|uniref:uncharacterized protein n=1 Tax=Arachis hypogaea TaxID=3818 RepID=UPI000DECC08E|nr:uncharacterized protein LOC112735632 [Arachis hypogaea]
MYIAGNMQQDALGVSVLPSDVSDIDESYNKVSRLLQALQSCCLEIICEFKVVLYYDGHLMVHDYSMFDKVFWAFSACEEAFKNYKPFVSVDGMLLYSKYGGMLLIALAQDGDSNILSVAFTTLRADNSGWQSARAFHAYCVRYMAANFMSHFKSAEGKQYLINAAYSPSNTGYREVCHRS